MLKILAMTTMAVDHIGLMFYPGEDVLRMIGRIAFPLYAFFIAQGYRYTKNLKSYALRLLTMALICHLPVLFGIDVGVYNVIFTLFFGLMAIILLDRQRRLSLWIRVSGLAAIAGIAMLVPIDYGIYGVITVVMYHFLRNGEWLIGHLALNLCFFIFQEISLIQWYSVVATLLILSRFQLPVVPVNRTFYWLFYPGHLLVLYVLRMII